jgi:FkbM family methyltransferase
MKISYAQNFEDIMLWRALKDVRNGFYIDVGSHDPDADSVTKLFYEQGWHGINIDPNPLCQPKFEASRDQDINLQLAVTDHAGDVELEFNETGLSSINRDMIASHEGRGFKFQKVTVKGVPLADIWATHVPDGQEVHFLKVDVEGAEEAVLRSADFSRHRPWIIVVEATVPLSQEEDWQSWEPLLTDANYLFAYEDGLNRFYVAAERRDLIAAFRYPPNIFDDFVHARSMNYGILQGSVRQRVKRWLKRKLSGTKKVPAKA